MKTFKDLNFEQHVLAKYTDYRDCKQAVINFENGYGVSVLLGNPFYSNGKDSYELAILYNGEISYNTDITDDVLGYLSEGAVTEIMSKVQNLK